MKEANSLLFGLAVVKESLFCKLFPQNQPVVSVRDKTVESSKVDEELRFLLNSSTNEPGLLKLKKPWKRVKWDWSKGSFASLGKIPVDST